MDDTFKVISIDELADLCGYFTSATDANNGYGCNHPEQENYEMLYKDESGYTQRENTTGSKEVKQGKCYAFSCPLASKCNMEDLMEYDKDEYDDIKSSNPDMNDDELDLEVDRYDLMLINEKNLNKKASLKSRR
jgi:hypothetical protein